LTSVDLDASSVGSTDNIQTIFELLYNRLRLLPAALIIRRKRAPLPESPSELCRLNDHRSSAKLVPTFADRGCCVVSTTEPHVRFFFKFSRPVCSLLLELLFGPEDGDGIFSEIFGFLRTTRNCNTEVCSLRWSTRVTAVYFL
jgi:hypothetical protein